MNEERPPSKFGGQVWAEQGAGKIDQRLLEISNDEWLLGLGLRGIYLLFMFTLSLAGGLV